MLGEGALTIPREGSTESESTQEDLEEEEEEEEEVEEEEVEDCIQVKDEERESGAEEGPDLEESSAGYKKVAPCAPALDHQPSVLPPPLSAFALPSPQSAVSRLCPGEQERDKGLRKGERWCQS